MSLRIARRLQDIEPFRVVEVLTEARALAARGVDVVHMEAGEPDFATAAPIIDAAKRALDNGATYYTSALGLPELRQQISAFYRQQYHIDVSPSRILVTPGASGALLLVASLLINPGEGLLMADPGYPCNRNFLRLVEGEGQLVAVDHNDRYQLTAERAEAAWQANTVGAIVASPANPTGEILTRQQLQDLYQLTARKNGVLVVDEIYHGLTYGEDAPSILEITDQAFVINSFSKFFGMTGWRLGWLVAPEEAVPHLERLAQNLFISMSTMAQYGALAGFEPETLAILNQRRDIFAERRDFLLPALREIGFDIPHTPAGALYIYAGIDRFSSDSTAFCKQMLAKHAVALTPGADFGHYRADRHVRFAYTTSMTQLEKGVERLRAALR
ncbi:MAG TPA: pyridoxal phosphate-dependent aminotransferase [Pseudomonadales bacterium]